MKLQWQYLIGLTVTLGLTALLFQNCERAQYSRYDKSVEALGDYTWQHGNFGSCSQTCGGGQQSRSVWCGDYNGAIVDDNKCSGAKPTPTQACNTQACTGSQSVTQTVKLIGPSHQVDVLMIIDDSSSMAPEQEKLAERMGEFFTELGSSQVNWQMCVTTTDVGYYNGDPLRWSTIDNHILKASSGNAQSIFSDTVTAIGSGYSTDEQAIKATILAMRSNSRHNCFRDGAALSVIVLSDEDERSVGGNQALSMQQYKPLETDNRPATAVSEKNKIFGNSKRFTFNSIIVKPNDTQCEQMQDTQASPSFQGRQYAHLSSLTNGAIGSICDTNYSSNLNYFADTILSSLSEVELECLPSGSVTLTTNPTVSGLTHTVAANKITFNKVLPYGTTLTLKYDCSQ